LHRIPDLNSDLDTLAAVSCTSARACIAVGDEVLGSSGPDVLLAMRWDGRRWKFQNTPEDQASDWSFDDVSCVSSTDCTAVGARGAANLAAHWNGHRWSVEPMSAAARQASGELMGVWCAAGTACVSVGSFGLVERRVGQLWRPERLPIPAGAAPGSLDAVACSSDSGCMAVGPDSTRRWTGSQWAPAQPPSAGVGATLLGVSCTSAAACTAVGWSDQGVATRPVVERWNGRRWAVQRSPRLDGQLSGVSCPAPTRCIAVGSATAAQGAPVVERWNGTKWVAQLLAGEPGGGLDGVSCPSTTICVAVGANGASPIAALWDGATWTTQSTPIPAAGGQGTLSAVSCASAAACTAVGFCDACTAPDAEQTLAERWDGTRWSIQDTPNVPGSRDRLTSVSCSAPTACTAVGRALSTPPAATAGLTKPVIESWAGTTWTTEAPAVVGPFGRSWTNDQVTLNGVFCSTAACTAVGTFASGGDMPLIERRHETITPPTQP
jgi:hypothetical protein